MQELLTREERDRLAERLLPGEKILWQGKSRCGWWRRAAKEWKGMLFSVFFAHFEKDVIRHIRYG